MHEKSSSQQLDMEALLGSIANPYLGSAGLIVALHFAAAMAASLHGCGLSSCAMILPVAVAMPWYEHELIFGAAAQMRKFHYLSK